nr:MAG TPA: hypothetical protein [Caudoviricetes sp.]
MKALPLFCCEGEPLSFLLYFFSFGRGYIYAGGIYGDRQYRKGKRPHQEKISFCFFARAVVRCIVKHDTLGRRRPGSPGGDKNAA